MHVARMRLCMWVGGWYMYRSVAGTVGVDLRCALRMIRLLCADSFTFSIWVENKLGGACVNAD